MLHNLQLRARAPATEQEATPKSRLQVTSDDDAFESLVGEAVVFPHLKLRPSLIGSKYVLIHLHIPKTAGVSFYSHLCKTYPFVAFNHARLQESVAEFCQKSEASPSFLTGHIFFEDYLKILPKIAPRTPVIVSIVRDPIERLVSYYNYCRSPKHRWSDSFRADFPSFESYIESPNCYNLMSRYLFGNKAGRVTEINQALRNNSYALASSGETDRLIRSLCGKPILAPESLPRRNVLAPEFRELKVAHLSERTLQTIRERHALDILLYNAVRAAEEFRSIDVADILKTCSDLLSKVGSLYRGRQKARTG